jgi:hypothetical protein
MVLRVTRNMCRKHRAMSGPKEGASGRAPTPDLSRTPFRAHFMIRWGLASQAGSRNQERPLIGGMPDVSAGRRVYGSTPTPRVGKKSWTLSIDVEL